MDNDKIQINYSYNGNTKTFNVGYANPNATDFILKTFAEKIMELSNGTLNTVKRVKTTDITNAQEG